jgi:hypothetical protein
MDNVQKHNIYINIVPSSQTFISYLFLDTVEFKHFTNFLVTSLLVQVEQVGLVATF